MDYPDFSLTNQVALVTGAGRGIGFGVAKAPRECGCKGGSGCPFFGGARRVGGRNPLGGRDCSTVPLDVRDIAQVRAWTMFRALSRGLDILVNIAGLGANHPALDLTESDWDEMMAVNLKGVFFRCQAAARIMLLQRRGRIINISSQASLVGIRDPAVYCSIQRRN